MIPDDGDGRALEADTEELYEHAPCALLSTRPDGLIIRANQTFLAWIGRSAGAVVGQLRLQAMLSVGARMYYETHYAPLLHMQGFVNEIALEVRRADGKLCPVVASARQLRDASGAPTLVRVALFDSTDRRRYERELLVARKQAEEAARHLADVDRQKNEFIAILAHELRNPLAPMRSAVEVLRRTESTDETVGRTTAMMQRQVAQMTRLVEDLLDLSRIGQDKLTMRRVPVDLASVVHYAIEMSVPVLDKAGVAFEAILPDLPIYAEADASRLAQAISNVLNNAAKFTPRGGSATLTLERSGEHAVIRVRDTGVGIAETQLAVVFEMFMQAGSSGQRRDGLGIGLTLAKSFIERHDGRVSVHSEGPDCGTEVVIHLPVRSVPLDSVDHPFRSPSQPRLTVPRRILIVDDNRDSAELMALLLGSSGHETRVAYDGQGALDLAAVFQPHVMLLDIGLPGLSGYEVAARIRREQGHQPVLVALTGWGQEDDRQRSAAAGFDHHLVKPVDHDVLMQLVHDIAAPQP